MSVKKDRAFYSPNDIVLNKSGLNLIKYKLQLLDELNYHYRKNFQHIAKYSHIGSFDLDKTLVVLYIDNQEAVLQVKRYLDDIAQKLNQIVTVSQVLIRVKPKSQDMVKRKKYINTPLQKQGLEKLALMIDRPDLITENKSEIEEETPEIFF